MIFATTGAKTVTPVTMFDPSAWGQYGLIGLVVMALLAGVFYLLKQSASERREYLELNKKTTDEFRQDVKEITRAHNDANKEMTDKFVQLHTDTMRRLIVRGGGTDENGFPM